MTVYYAGVGSRSTPKEVMDQMRQFAYQAAKRGWVLRSGGANGADTAFEDGCDDGKGKKEIFLPWREFNQNSSPLYSVDDRALALAKEIHPAYNSLSRTAKLLIGRNMHQVLGKTLSQPVACVVCWTKDGCESWSSYGRNTGGTGSAISLASHNGAVVFNLYRQDRFIDALEFLLNDGVTPK